MSQHLQTGRRGESLAMEYLANVRSFVILEKNWRFSRAEIDIIARDGETLVFIEVKSRSSATFGRPEDFVSHRKMLLVQDAANEFMKKAKHEWAIRFDVVSILFLPDGSHELEHIEDAWW